MRFEVKGGGIAAILFALTLLSAAVFVLGLLAGYDVGRQAQIDTAQLATSYPLQSPPSSAAPSHLPGSEPDNPAMQSASTSASPAAGTSTPATAASAGLATSGESTSPKRRPSPPGATPARQRLVSASIPSAAHPASTTDSAAAAENAAAPDSENSEAADEPSEAASNSSLRAGHSEAAAIRHKAYNIQIEAAMDISGADKMMARLQKLGYASHLVPTEIGGQRWYKVEVGPYETAEEASSAEAEMRERYDQTYGGVARGTSSHTNANDDSQE